MKISLSLSQDFVVCLLVWYPSELIWGSQVCHLLMKVRPPSFLRLLCNYWMEFDENCTNSLSHNAIWLFLFCISVWIITGDSSYKHGLLHLLTKEIICPSMTSLKPLTGIQYAFLIIDDAFVHLLLCIFIDKWVRLQHYKLYSSEEKLHCKYTLKFKIQSILLFYLNIPC